MHIAEGVLSGTTQGLAVLGVGIAISAVGTAIGLRKLDYERMPQVGMLSAAFFVVSLIALPQGATSLHLVLCGLMGLILGWATFPAVLVAVLLQAVFLAEGGLTTLGINTATMAVPGVICYYLFRRSIHADTERMTFLGAFFAGTFAFMLGLLLVSAAVFASGEQFGSLAKVVLLPLPVALVEGFITGSVVVFLRKVRPELLDAPVLSTVAGENTT